MNSRDNILIKAVVILICQSTIFISTGQAGDSEKIISRMQKESYSRDQSIPFRANFDKRGFISNLSGSLSIISETLSNRALETS